jgi:hypothetical protein
LPIPNKTTELRQVLISKFIHFWSNQPYLFGSQFCSGYSEKEYISFNKTIDHYYGNQCTFYGFCCMDYLFDGIAVTLFLQRV